MSRTNPVVPTLELSSPTIVGRLIELKSDELRVGRDPSSEIWLNQRQVSWKHARLTRQSDGTYHVEDMGSYNSTYLDGKRLPPCQPAPLRDGSQIRICDATLTFRLQAVAVD